MQHLDRLLTTNATSRQHKIHFRLSLNATHTSTHNHKILLSNSQTLWYLTHIFTGCILTTDIQSAYDSLVMSVSAGMDPFISMETLENQLINRLIYIRFITNQLCNIVKM